MKILLSLQHLLPSKQQTIVNSNAKNTTKISKEFWHVSSKAYHEITFNMTCSPQYSKWLEQLRNNCSPIIPKFDMDLVSTPRTSQSFQFSNSRPSPTTDVPSNQSSQLAHPFYQSSTNWRQQLAVTSSGYYFPPHFYKGLQEASRTIPFSSTPQPLPPHINAYALKHMLHTFYLPLPLPPPRDPPYFCAIMNSLSQSKI